MMHSCTPLSFRFFKAPPWKYGLCHHICLLLCFFLAGLTTAKADSGFYKDFVVLQTNGGGNTYYSTYTGFSVPNPAFHGINLGVFDLTASSPALVLQGAEANTYDGNGATMQAARLYYRVYEEGSVPGRFVPIELTYRYAGIDGGANNRKWDHTSAGIDLVRTASRNGRFVLEVYFQAEVSYAGQTFQNYDSNNGANYRATFTVSNSTQALAPPSYAQVDQNFRTYVNQVFGQLESNRVSTGLLLDYGFDFANPRIYDGSLLEDSTLMEPGVYADLYKTLYTSRFNMASAAMRHPSIHDSLCYAARTREVITLSGLLFRYNAIDPQAQAGGRLQTVNGQLKDQYTNGVWQNPYQQLTTVAISPSTTHYRLTDCQVQLPSSLFLSNLADQISHVELDANDGRGYQALPFDTPLSLHYGSVGFKHWLFKITLANGQQLFSHSKVFIDSTSNIAGSMGAQPRSQTVTRATIQATEAYLGQAGVADIIITYRSEADRVLRRPLIFAEGFDPGHILTPEEPEGDNTLDRFITRVGNSGSGALERLLTDPVSQYDIVYVNWRNGTDHLQRNALVLEEIIRWVNRNKQPFSTGGALEPNVVLGSSMGGVIARMALGRMDRAGGFAAHQTRLYVSIDAPHLGANVPLGYQAAARHASRIYIATGGLAGLGNIVEAVHAAGYGPSPLKSLFLADQPAARQLLINRINFLDQLNNAPHDQFQQELRTSWAYPNPATVRSLAISNGSECAIDQEFAPDSRLFYYYRSVRTRFLSDILLMAGGVGLTAAGAPWAGGPLVIPGSNKFELTLDIKAAANGGGNQVYHGNVKFTKKVLWLVPVKINIVDGAYSAPSGVLPLDSNPGGFYTLPIGFKPGGNKQNWFLDFDGDTYLQNRFSFIPTASALDIGQGTTTLTQANYLARYIGATPPTAPLNSPFANFTTAFNQNGDRRLFDNDNFRLLNNEPHEGIFLRSANWLAQELTGAPMQTNCSAFCGNNAYAIVGNSLICTSSDYSIANLPAGIPVTWTIPSSVGATLTLNPNTPNFAQARITNQNYYAVTTTLTARISGGPCGAPDIVLSKDISNDNRTSFPYFQESCTFYNVNHPSQSGTASASASTFVHQGCMVYVDLGPIPRTVTINSGGGQPLVWGTMRNGRYPNTLYFQLPLGSGGVPFYFTIAGGSDCGDQTLVFFSISNNARYSYAATPVPAADEVTVTAKKNEEYSDKSAKRTTVQPLSYTVEVYEVTTGARKITQQNKAGSLTNRINIANLRPGYYILHINDGESSQKIKIYKE